jgi:hypothetical protein
VYALLFPAKTTPVASRPLPLDCPQCETSVTLSNMYLKSLG